MRNQIAKYLFQITTLPKDIAIKSSAINLPPRIDWFSRIQGPKTMPSFDVKFPTTKKLLFLDMDETILARSSHWFYNGKNGSRIGEESFFVRPHLHSFLKQVESKYHVILFTASYPKRLTSILPFLNYKFHMTLHREFTTPGRAVHIYKNKIPVFKDLNRFKVDLTNCILLDDNPNYFLSCRENGIKIKPYFGDAKDDELLRYSDLLLQLAESNNMQYAISNLKVDYPDVFDGTRWIF